MAEPPLKPNHRWLQCRLRTLLVLTAIIAVGLGWWSYRIRPQQVAVAALTKAGATVLYDFQEVWMVEQFRMGSPDRPPRWPAWLVDTLGVDWFSAVNVVQFHPTATDNDLKHLRSLTNVEEIYLYHARVTDTGMENLKRLSKLHVLTLAFTPVSDAGLEHLNGLTALRELNLKRTKVTAAGVARLQKSLPNCTIRH